MFSVPGGNLAAHTYRNLTLLCRAEAPTLALHRPYSHGKRICKYIYVRQCEGRMFTCAMNSQCTMASGSLGRSARAQKLGRKYNTWRAKLHQHNQVRATVAAHIHIGGMGPEASKQALRGPLAQGDSHLPTCSNKCVLSKWDVPIQLWLLRGLPASLKPLGSGLPCLCQRLAPTYLQPRVPSTTSG